MDRKQNASHQEFGSGAVIENAETWGVIAGVGGYGKLQERVAGSGQISAAKSQGLQGSLG